MRLARDVTPDQLQSVAAGLTLFHALLPGTPHASVYGLLVDGSCSGALGGGRGMCEECSRGGRVMRGLQADLCRIVAERALGARLGAGSAGAIRMD